MSFESKVQAIAIGSIKDYIQGVGYLNTPQAPVGATGMGQITAISGAQAVSGGISSGDEPQGSATVYTVNMDDGTVTTVNAGGSRILGIGSYIQIVGGVIVG